ncbi:hypothetical protein [Microbacterium candidum]|uniref:Uncharacterized protein n=1 Tax=Microbacterium candidum TaxID=3041922 RepID=A0ABT7N2V2_9MICO|nr:hypothetical protein [Microbacterium sp. ASV49]MDL9980996.1 hypothetical protein [Microbacterium sp. ASV49]
MDDYLWVLKDSERDLLREIESTRMERLDEDELLSLHKRIRRARNKHVTNYRRKAARTVVDMGSRGAAHPKGSKDRLRAEAFEEALARVSERLAALAHEHAEQLKNERLARAQAGKETGPDSAPISGGKVSGAGVTREHRKTSGGKKRDASSRAQGARRQAERDSR